MSLLEIKQLKASYTRHDGTEMMVLDIPRFEIERAKRMAVRGRSGSGKTTFLNVISGILLPVSGQIQLDGKEITRMSESERDLYRGRKIGFIYQGFHLLPGFTAWENVLLGATFAGDPHEDDQVTRDRAKSLLNKVGLSRRMDHQPRTLSMGEQQRVAVARALMNSPRLILADEPTGSLDEKSGNDVLELIQSLCEEIGAALLLVTHDPSVMSRFSETVDLKDLNQLSGL